MKSLQGNWRDEHLFIISESYKFYNIYQERIAACDAQIETQLKTLELLQNDGIIDTTAHEWKSSQKKGKNQRDVDIRRFLHKIHGVDVIEIYGLSHIAGLEILAKTGTDLSKWETEKHFVSWLNLSPNNKISGGKLISSQDNEEKAEPSQHCI